jgi:predicted DCC family thiol-disulfide oxidoreductase YuxK
VRRPVVLYDGACRFCRWSARTIARLDRRQRLAFLPFADPLAVTLLEPLPPEEKTASWRLAEPDGRLLAGAAAGASLLAHLGAGRVADAARRQSHLLDRVYALVARRRRRLGSFVPDGAAPRRYP